MREGSGGISLPLADVVATSTAVSSTRARSAKVAALAELLQRVPSAEIAITVGFLVGAPRQGRVGVGWALLGPAIDIPPAAEATLTVADVDGAIDELERTTGPAAPRRAGASSTTSSAGRPPKRPTSCAAS